jgi:excisionase family DNA binding protein
MTTLLKPRDAAAYLGVSLRTYEDLCRSGQIRAFFLGDQRIRRVTVDDLDAFIATKRGQVTER